MIRRPIRKPVPKPPLVLVAHGTRNDAGTTLIGRLADEVARKLPGVTVRPAFVDVRRPTVADALAELAGPVVLVPAFLAAGYHVREDLPRQVAEALSDSPDRRADAASGRRADAASGRRADAASGRRAVITPLLGPDPLLIAAAADRLARAGWRPGDVVVLGAAGSRDPRARTDLIAAADALGARLGTEVRAGYLASGEPSAVDLIGELRGSRRRVAAASWLLAPGLFQRRLAESGAQVVAEPLGVHPGVVRAVVSRYRDASGRAVTADRSAREEVLERSS